ncbi:MAG TPA: beta-ketoacyl synthase N-terminal-like domain-containing protein [Acidimicrobiales bacterium]|nr:beta-ketoacyl synthase N-terminal-like domain-containing protein [Acidimicrobiales bacterium]
MSRSDVDDGVAIVGMGAVFPGAADLGAYWANLIEGVDAIGDVPASRIDPVFFAPESDALDRFACRRGGFVDGLAEFDPTEFGMMPVSVAAAEPDQLIALSTAAAALDDAGGVATIADRTKAAVIIGRGGYITAGVGRLEQRVRTAEQLVRSLRQLVPGVTDEQLEAVRDEFQRQLGPYHAEDAIGLVPNLVASRIANRFDFAGPAYTVDAACASSLVALDHAVRLLRSGECDLVIAGGVHHCHDLTLWAVFSQLGAVSASGHIRPFSRQADGLLIGEGTGMMVLKRLADACAADDRVYAVIRGVGLSSDGRGATVMRPGVAGQVLAVRRGWAAAALDPSTIGLLEAHGTATPAGDAAELETVTEVFGPRSESNGSGPVPMGSVKSMIGHAMPAAGAAGVIKAALALHHQTLPPTLHCEEPHPGLAGTRFRPVTSAEPWEATVGRMPRRAGVNSFGFGGINGHVVLEEHPGRGAGTLTNRRAVGGATARSGGKPGSAGGDAGLPGGMVLCAADDERSLLAQLDDRSFSPSSTGRLRLAVVKPTSERLDLARKVVASGDAWRGRMDVWFSPQPLLRHGGRMAFLFPGIEAAAPVRVADVAARFGLAPPPEADTGRLGQHGIAVFALGRFLDAALAGIGVAPDVIAGHSIGEWNGMVAAGMVRPETAGPYLARLDPDAIGMPELVYAAAGCAASRAADAVDGIADVVVSHDNCPHQSILCGTEPAIAITVTRLRALGVMASELPFRSGFHSPMFLPRLRGAREALDLLPLEPPSRPLWSATTCEPYPDKPDQVRELAARHLIERIRFRELILRLHEEGVRAFVQVGVGSLVGFVDDTLREHDHLAVSAASGTGSAGLDQLRRVAAALWVEGAAVRFDRLMEEPASRSAHRRPVSLDTPLVSLAALPPLTVAPTPPATRFADRAAPAIGRPTPEAAWAAPVADRAAPAAPAAPPAAPTHQTISVERFPWLVDHCLVRQRTPWPSIADRFPVVPLTTMIRWLTDRGAATQPGRVVTRVERIRAARWLAAAPPVEVKVSATNEDHDHVRVAIEGYSQATVVLADRAPTPPPVDAGPLPDEEPAQIGPEELYEHRWMFHGPQFQAVCDIQGMCTAGIRGRIRVLDAPGTLLDGAGQLVGYWAMARTERDRIVLPTGVDHIDLYGPEPPVGAIVDCTVRITGIEDDSIRADLDLVAAGRLWARVVGWTEHRFETDDVMFDVLRFPEYHLASQPQPGGWVLTPERWRRSASRDLVMRQYLTGSEREHYHGLNPLAQRQWLLGRMAAKDAVRDWLWNEAPGKVFPAEIEVVTGRHGEPLLTGPLGEHLRISLAHSKSLAVAIVADGTPVGIDIEAVAPRDDHFRRTVLTEAEHGLVPATDVDRWLTRFWTAKEAVAKAAGTGLGGRPKDFEVAAVEDGALRIGERWVDTDVVTDDRGGEFVVGWTRL